MYMIYNRNERTSLFIYDELYSSFEEAVRAVWDMIDSSDDGDMEENLDKDDAEGGKGVGVAYMEGDKTTFWVKRMRVMKK